MNIIKKSIAVVALSTIAIFGLAACTDKGAAPSTDSSATSAEKPVEQTPPPVNDLLKPLGEIITYEDGLSVSVSEPATFVPTENAAGADQANQILLSFAVTNNTVETLDPIFGVSVSSGGVEASQIYDVNNAAGEVNFSPNTAVLPGQTVVWNLAFSIADPTSITVDFSPGFEWESAIFTNIPV